MAIPMTKKRSTKRVPVLVTTARGVFFGELDALDEDKKQCTLRDARCAIYWATTRGFLELASDGPNPKSKIGATAPKLTLYEITSVTETTAAAAAKWRAFP